MVSHLNNNFYKSRLDLTTEKICKLLLDKKLSNMYDIREALYEYQTNNEDINLLLKKILYFFTNECNVLLTDKKLILVKTIAESNQKLQKSYKEVVHIEDLFFKIFSLIHKS